MIKNFLPVLQIILSVLLSVCILLQSRGQGLSSSMGGGGEFYRSKRGMEKFLVWLTVILTSLLTLTLLLNLAI